MQDIMEGQSSSLDSHSPMNMPVTAGARSILDRTVQVLQRAESLVFNRSQLQWKRAEVLVDSFWHGPSFVMSGIAEQLQLLKVGLVLIVLWWILMVLVGFLTGTGLAGWGQAGWGAAVMATACLVFRIPRVATLHGVKRSSVIVLAVTMRELCPEETSISSLKDNLASLSAASEKQASRIQTFLGLYWAALVWFVVTWVLPPAIPQATRDTATGWAFLASFVFVIAGIALIGYSTASRVFWQTIDLAVSEAGSGTVEPGMPLPDGVSRPATT